MDLFPGFAHRRIAHGDIEINARIGGDGPPLLLLHGYPQSHVMWHKVAPRLAAHYTVVAADLRGYGDSSKPPGDPEHANYSKRELARDQVALMRALGFERFLLAGHDRGARVAHRLALDHPERVRRLAVLDIAPTLAMYERTDMAFARAYYHWFFLIQPAPFPETLINHDRGFYLRAKLGLARANPFDPAALAEYLRCYDEATVHASCEDYRAAAGIDLEHDRADRAAGRRVRCPVLALWGRHGVIERCYRPLEVWREYADEVSGRALEAGHYLAEEVPDAVYDELVRFFGAAGT